MFARRFKQQALDESAAIAPLYALVLFALVGVAGVGFDYARMASLQSELQNAADQAALAGATQLDQTAYVDSNEPGSCARAARAAQSYLENFTRFAKDGDPNRTVTLGSNTEWNLTNDAACDQTGMVRFYKDEQKAIPANFAEVRFIEVVVDARSTTFALTPLIDLFTSGDMTGIAMAGLGSALCKVPPVMMCNPNESTDPDFNVANYVGKGIRLVANVNGANGAGEAPDEPVGSYGPGVFGYLETGAGNGAIATARTLGRDAIPGDCTPLDGADVKPGQQVSVLDALNTRYGVFDNGLNNVCGPNDALCSASGNSRIDLVKRNGNNCRIGSNGFQVGPAPYRPNPVNWANDLSNAAASNLQPMGFPRDKCHAFSLAGACSGNGNARVGNGDWDRNAYQISQGATYGTWPTMWEDYGYPELAGRTVPTRYQVYRWEYDNNELVDRPVPGAANLRAQGAPLCNPPGRSPEIKPDRRVLSVAVLNCATADDGQPVSASTTTGKIEKFIDVFLVEPTARRTFGGTRYTNNSDVYIEVIGTTGLGGGPQSQEVRRDVPYLVH